MQCVSTVDCEKLIFPVILNMKDMGRWIIYFGIAAIVIGLIMNQFSDKLGWIGRLPGDIHLGSGKVKFYFPLTSLIILNLIIIFILRLIEWFK